MEQIKAPNKLKKVNNKTLFLAGSIEMGNAINWQTRFVEALVDKDVTIFNPRRDDWDSSWEQSIHNDKFREQVEWELRALEKADIIAMYFDAATKSPITLLELGLFARSKKLIVCCPQGFWRKGNADVVCARYKVMIIDTLENLIDTIRNML